jgi:orotidine-5'-phosphate decarboxylase
MKDKIIVALDVSSRAEALHLVKELKDLCEMFKVGSQLFMAAGPAIAREIVDLGGRVFLDLKFHDIPNSITQAAVEAGKLGVSMMTVHASGGRVMLQSVIRALGQKFGASRPMVVAVTVLTSLDLNSLSELGFRDSVDQEVQRLAMLAQDCGMDGVVCSPREIAMLRPVVHTRFKLVTPGIRLPDQTIHDQRRTATPGDAIAAGADYIVLGRAITEQRDPQAALQRILRSL